MDDDRRQRISRLYHEALERPVYQRDAFLDACCQGDEVLHREVASLLAHEVSAQNSYVKPAAEVLNGALAQNSAQLHIGLEPGVSLGTYRIERALGRGGMGVVFLVHDATLHRHVALKVLGSPAGHGSARARLLREARNAAALNHPNICTVYEVGEADGHAFIAMEYVEGRPLSDWLAQSALPLADAIRYGIEAAEALAYAHDHGVIHHDLKAANAIVTQSGRLKLVDFGLARREDALVADATTMPSLATAGVAVGTPYAMAPEQVRGGATDARTDIWALGVLLYEMVSGAKPFIASTIPELFSSILRDAPAPLADATPVALQSVIERCLEKAPERRYESAREVRAALEAIQAGAMPPWATWRARIRRRPWAPAAVGALAVAALVVGGNVGGMRDRLVGNPPASIPIKLAVLPFENLTGDPEQEFFSDGLTEEMITQLGRLHPQRLSVIARTSSMRYKNRDVPLNQIGRELGVDYVMEGSARREGTHVRISAILIRVADQTQQWADSFDRELAGILALQSDVARSIGASLQLTLLPAEQTRLASSGQVNPDAYEASLKGRFHADKLTPQDLDVALKYFDLALTIDPTYAPAYTGIALVWNGKTQMGYTMPAEAMPKIKAAATRAIELDDSSAFAHAALAGAAWSEWDWETSEREFRRALELDPGDAKTHAFYSHLLIALNRPDDARRAGQRALDLDPFNDFHRALYGTVLYLIRRYDEATAELGNVVRTSPDHPVAVCALWYTFNALGRPEQALTAAGGCLGHYSGDVKDILAKGFSESGYSGAMRRVGDWLAAGVGGAYIAPIDVFIAYLHAGDKDLALQWLSRIVDARDPNLSGAVRDPFANDSLGHDPRFHEIVRRSKLPV